LVGEEIPKQGCYQSNDLPISGWENILKTGQHHGFRYSQQLAAANQGRELQSSWSQISAVLSDVV
jgi:hypothetical protein